MIAVEGRGFSELRDALPRAARPHVPAHLHANDRAVWAHQLTGRVRRTSTLSPIQGGTCTRDAPAGHGPADSRRRGAPSSLRRRVRRPDAREALEDGLFGATSIPRYVGCRPVHSAPRSRFPCRRAGLITMGVTYAIAIAAGGRDVLPDVRLPRGQRLHSRLAIFCDRIFRVTNGKPSCRWFSVSAATPWRPTTRILGTPKERLIAILLLAPGSCSAQLATIMGILGGISFAADDAVRGRCHRCSWSAGWPRASCPATAPNSSSSFRRSAGPASATADQDAPARVAPARRSRCSWSGPRCCSRSTASAPGVLPPRAGRWSLACSTAAGGRADVRHGFPAPRLRRGRAVPARAQRSADRRAAVVALTVMTLFVPCVANFLMMVRERGLKTGFAILGVVTPVAIFTGAGLNYVLHAFGVQF